MPQHRPGIARCQPVSSTTPPRILPFRPCHRPDRGGYLRLNAGSGHLLPAFLALMGASEQEMDG
jgi:hypothetical protein